ncbi:Uncharacterised protein [Streptococcus mutans]|nr:Uncharacterised protein [Streptococcus mutans]
MKSIRKSMKLLSLNTTTKCFNIGLLIIKRLELNVSAFYKLINVSPVKARDKIIMVFHYHKKCKRSYPLRFLIFKERSKKLMHHFNNKICHLFRAFNFTAGNPHLADAKEGVDDVDRSIFPFNISQIFILKIILDGNRKTDL